MAFSGTYDIATITNPSSALTDFTLIVDLSNTSAGFKAAWDTSLNGKGRAVKGDGVTELACDWIDLDHTAKTGILRVKWSGTLASSGTQQLRIYPPNTANTSYLATDTYGQYNAYDSNWEGYYPLEDVNDRTANAVNLTISGTPPGFTTGKLLNGFESDGIFGNGIFNSSGPTFPSNNNITVLGWCNGLTVSGEAFLGSDSAYEMVIRNTGGNIEFVLNSFSTNDRVLGTTTIGSGWQHFGGRYNGASLDVFYGGGLDGSVIPIGSYSQFSGIDIGYFGRGVSASGHSAAIYDEVQIHSVPRTDEWISEEYSQTNDNATFWGTWTNVPVSSGYTLTADAGTLSITGQNAGLSINRSVSAEAGSLGITGQDATLTTDRVLVSETGTMTITGQDANLIYGAGYILNAEAGSLGITGQDATLTTDRVLVSETGTMTITGQDANLIYGAGYILNAEAGSLGITGQDANLIYGQGFTLTAETGSFSIVGQDASLKVNRVLISDSFGSSDITKSKLPGKPEITNGKMVGKPEILGK